MKKFNLEYLGIRHSFPGKIIQKKYADYFGLRNKIEPRKKKVNTTTELTKNCLIWSPIHPGFSQELIETMLNVSSDFKVFKGN